MYPEAAGGRRWRGRGLRAHNRALKISRSDSWQVTPRAINTAPELLNVRSGTTEHSETIDDRYLLSTQWNIISYDCIFGGQREQK